MRALVFEATVLLATISIAGLAHIHAQQGSRAMSNMPLAFGMDANEASQALGTTLYYVRGHAGNETYLARPNVTGAALSDRKDGLYLQFRRGRLEGWKGDWATDRRCCN